MAEKKKKGRRSYLADYVQDVNGQYVYTGSHYLAQMDGASMPRLLRRIFGLLLLAMLALIGVGCLYRHGFRRILCDAAACGSHCAWCPMSV